MESTFSCCAYCWKNELSWEKLLCFKCDGCQKKVHYDCIRSMPPSPLLGDTFFHFKCQACGEVGKEEFVRSSLSWHKAVMLALYNLHKTSQGRCGYFHWKGHIGAFIDQHWNTLFGYQRKKTTVWMGTVAGTLSTGCPEYFLSGTHVGQQGHWRLAEVEPPTAHCEQKKQHQRRKHHETPVELNPDKRKCRRSGESALAAAVELKEKRSTLLDIRDSKKHKCLQLEDKLSTLGETGNPSANSSREGEARKKKMQRSEQKKLLKIKEQIRSPDIMTFNLKSEISEETYLPDSQKSNALSLATNSSYPPLLISDMMEDVNHLDDLLLMAADIDAGNDLDLEVTENSLDPRSPSPDVDIMLSADTGYTSYGRTDKPSMSTGKTSSLQVKQETKSDTESECLSEKNITDEPISDSDEEEEDRVEQYSGEEEEERIRCIKQEQDDVLQEQEASSMRKRLSHPHKRRKADNTSPTTPLPQLKRISLFEEDELLQKMNDMATKQALRPELAQFRRKLICNQTNREFGLPVFDLEKQMGKLARLDRTSSQVPSSQQQPFLQYLTTKTAETRDLDRFMVHASTRKMECRGYTNFYQRLVGFKDHELTPVVSPYTTRVLLPFIWRNFEMSHKPLKLSLLQDILAYSHRNDPNWLVPPSAPLDYCYIRPEHVPSVNALCREFFWPGIDVSECLQYPDFSCVVLYRKIVVAFAFMVPDRGYNEAYISFIFTHPEWRGAGIGTFMLYHLIQTCMGKDVLLHVSVTNPAMLLYQKFGFKCQELILNFYHKYFLFNCKESTHAFLMRLSR